MGPRLIRHGCNSDSSPHRLGTGERKVQGLSRVLPEKRVVAWEHIWACGSQKFLLVILFLSAGDPECQVQGSEG